MNRVPDDSLVKIPGGTLITETPEEAGPSPSSLIAAGQAVAIEFQTIAAANDYWR